MHSSLGLAMCTNSARTALAEAELEYVDNHKSDSVYVQVPVHGLGKRGRCVPRPPARNQPHEPLCGAVCRPRGLPRERPRLDHDALDTSGQPGRPPPHISTLTKYANHDQSGAVFGVTDRRWRTTPGKRTAWWRPRTVLARRGSWAAPSSQRWSRPWA